MSTNRFFTKKVNTFTIIVVTSFVLMSAILFTTGCDDEKKEKFCLKQCTLKTGLTHQKCEANGRCLATCGKKLIWDEKTKKFLKHAGKHLCDHDHKF
jgi:hypothetical protein